MNILRSIGKKLARYLSAPREALIHPATSSHELLAATLQPGDVLLVEGTSRFSEAIKYITQSTWSHAALYIGGAGDARDSAGDRLDFVEADVNDGVRLTALKRYSRLHTRICRPVGLTPDEIGMIINHAVGRIGHQYDLRNVIDLIRYSIQRPPVPSQWRRQLLALGAGDPTKAICSSMIAEAFQSVHYPILPISHKHLVQCPGTTAYEAEILEIRHHSLFAPRDFDVSPYFEIIKPTLASGFDPHVLKWQSGDLTPDEIACELRPPEIKL